MFLDFFYELRKAGIPATLREYLSFLGAMEKGVADFNLDDFYYLARASLVKDERNLDRFDVVFGSIFNGISLFDENGDLKKDLPEEWLKKLAELHLTEEEKKQIKSLGGFDRLMQTLNDRLEEQKGRHQGGNKWVGTAGRSPFGAYGYNPEGVRIGQDKSRHQRAVKVWDKREFKNLDDRVELGTRNLKIALRKLRKFAREGANLEFDLDGTINSTAKNAGLLDIKMVPERHNAVKVLLLLDVGGSMDWHVKRCEELFSAVRSEFKYLEHFYFHNCVYEDVWKDNVRRYTNKTGLFDLINTYPDDWKLIFVGDASMSAYEILRSGGAIEYYNEEAGEVWMRRLLRKYKNAVWLNPIPKADWRYTRSISIISDIMEDRMFPITLSGIEDAVKALR